MAQQLTEKLIKFIWICNGSCIVPNLSYTLIPAADDIAMPNLELKRSCPVPGGVEFLSICQGTCCSKNVIDVIT